MIETAEKDHLKGYPNLIFSHGEVPEPPPEKDFVADKGYEEDLLDDEDLNEDEIDGDEFY